MSYMNVAKAEQQGKVAAVVNKHVEEMSNELRGKEKLLRAKKRLIAEVLNELSDASPLPADTDLLQTVGVFQSATCELTEQQSCAVSFSHAWTYNIRSWICVGLTVVNCSQNSDVQDLCGSVDAQMSGGDCQKSDPTRVLARSQMFADNDFTRTTSVIKPGQTCLLVFAACRSTLRLYESFQIVCRWAVSTATELHIGNRCLHPSIEVGRVAILENRVAHVARVSLLETFPSLIDLRMIVHSGSDQSKILASLRVCQFSDLFPVVPGQTATSIISRLSRLAPLEFAPLQTTSNTAVLFVAEPPSWEGMWLIFARNTLHCFGWSEADIVGFKKLLRSISLLNDSTTS